MYLQKGVETDLFRERKSRRVMALLFKGKWKSSVKSKSLVLVTCTVKKTPLKPSVVRSNALPFLKYSFFCTFFRM